MNRTKIIIDWDDTLFPTTWFTKNKMPNLSDFLMSGSINDNTKEIKMIDRIIYLIIKKCLRYGEVMIITNATLDWIMVCLDFLPKTKKFLMDKKVPIISARQNTIINDMVNNKKITFKKVININNYDNIISIGDGMGEYLALINLCDEFIECNSHLKTIKLIEYPDIENILEQLIILGKSIKKIINAPCHLDLQFFHKNDIRQNNKKKYQ